MKVVIQRVNFAKVEVEQKIVGEIEKGLLILCGFEEIETDEEIQWMAKKVCDLRIFNDSENIMNLSVKDINANILAISQFTLMASTKKGNRPSYVLAAKGEIALIYYKKFVHFIEKYLDKKIEIGKFGKNMKVSLENDGPVTITIDTKQKT